MRLRLAEQLASAESSVDFSYLTRQNGMFSLLEVSAQEVERLRAEFHIYLVGSGRINLAALSDASAVQVANAIASIVRARCSARQLRSMSASSARSRRGPAAP
jgi:aspartate/tyrosine/aromatic aminotransferase